ncbi:flagellar motor protein MotB [Pseudomonas sp. S35]|uniref:OmpA family protein n=1 Tax=Pseudomonas sp. S35 TaxID=1573719 RepID=UPI00132EBE26|nr:OmpA family protein [Pseudomonas sp. S35]QHF44603.1 flagellar motor protein MotB [Pseudomonas sp. S35]
MTTVFEMRIQVGGDPRSFSEFTALRDELAKLSHPACPDVDWVKVEQWCLRLFEQNGADLQTACCYALACAQRQGVEGMAQGIALIEALVGEWSRVWPPMASSRLDLLGWLFDQLHVLLRRTTITTYSAPALAHLHTGLGRLQPSGLPLHPLRGLQALRQQVGLRLEQLGSSSQTLPPRQMVTALMAPVVILPPPEAPPRRHPIVPWLLASGLLAALFAGFAWRAWLMVPEPQTVLPEPVRLDSLSLFDTGSATLKPDSTKVLVKALVGIKAQPGWLIVIAGHTDATGPVEQNLALSHARASAVRDWMQRMGSIADSCFAVQGFAASQPIASNGTEEGRAANRRVDIHLVPQVGACEEVTSTLE